MQRVSYLLLSLSARRTAPNVPHRQRGSPQTLCAQRASSMMMSAITSSAGMTGLTLQYGQRQYRHGRPPCAGSTSSTSRRRAAAPPRNTPPYPASSSAPSNSSGESDWLRRLYPSSRRMAKVLGVDDSTIVRKIRRYGLRPVPGTN